MKKNEWCLFFFNLNQIFVNFFKSLEPKFIFPIGKIGKCNLEFHLKIVISF